MKGSSRAGMWVLVVAGAVSAVWLGRRSAGEEERGAGPAAAYPRPGSSVRPSGSQVQETRPAKGGLVSTDVRGPVGEPPRPPGAGWPVVSNGPAPGAREGDSEGEATRSGAGSGGEREGDGAVGIEAGRRGPRGTRLEARVESSHPTVLEGTRATLRIANGTDDAIELPERWLNVQFGYVAVEARFEDGALCESEMSAMSTVGEGKSVALAPGEAREVQFDLRWVARMTRVGNYQVRLGVDPSGRWGRGEDTRWHGEVMTLAVQPPDEATVARLLELVPVDAEWQEYRPNAIATVGDSGDSRLLPRFRSLRERLERDTELGVAVPGLVAEEIAFAEEKIGVWSLIRAGDWSEVRAFLGAGPTGSTPRRRMQEFVRNAYATRLIAPK